MGKKMEWISVKDRLPEADCVCLVMNIRGWMIGTRAVYYKSDDLFIEYVGVGGNQHLSLPLDVTHYLVIPERPLE